MEEQDEFQRVEFVPGADQVVNRQRKFRVQMCHPGTRIKNIGCVVYTRYVFVSERIIPSEIEDINTVVWNVVNVNEEQMGKFNKNFQV
jgi:hypothetical protein